MSQQIVLQPDGLFAVLSGNSDTFVTLDATEEELVRLSGEQARAEAERRTRKLIAQLRAGERPYFQFTRSWDEALDLHRRHAENADAEWNAEVEKTAARLAAVRAIAEDDP